MTDKRKRDDTLAAHNVALHYSGRENQSVGQRQQSPIYHLRCLNNWVKSMLINAYVREKDRVLDFACGKGGDLTKYRKARVGTYTGVDIALESVRRDAVGRYNGGNYPFPAKFIAGDAFTADLTQHLPVKSYDVVSSQFAIHYSWSTETRARRALRNVSQMLRPGGHFIGTTVDSNVLVRKLRATDGMTFGNSIVEVTFDDRFKRKTFDGASGPFGLQYAFTLQDAVTDCHECMVPRRAFVELAEEYGLELVEWRNFHDFVHDKLGKGAAEPAAAVDGSDVDGNPGPAPRPGEVHGGKRAAHALWRSSMGGAGVADETLSEDEWEAAHLYAAFAFRKAGAATAAAAAVLNRPDPGKAEAVRGEDVLVLEGAA